MPPKTAKKARKPQKSAKDDTLKDAIERARDCVLPHAATLCEGVVNALRDLSGESTNPFSNNNWICRTGDDLVRADSAMRNGDA